MTNIVNHNMMRSSNLISVFNCIRRCGPVTKKQIQDITGLSWGSISTLANQLADMGFITEKEAETTAVGRAPKGLDIDANTNLIIGLDINLQGLTGVIIDLKGRVHHQMFEPITGVERSAILPQTVELVNTLLNNMEPAYRKEVKGIGISFPGHVDPDKGVVLKIHHFNGFENFPLAKTIKDIFNLDVIIEHDPNCLGIAEQIQGIAQDLSDFIVVRFCRGIGMGIISGGEIFRGFTGATGEMGHMIINPGGALCQCGSYGCLETYSSGRIIIEKAEQARRLGLAPVLELMVARDSELDLDILAEAARAGDDYIRKLFNEAGAYMGIALANVINILDPKTVLIGGSVSIYDDLVMKPLSKVAKDNIWRQPPELDIRMVKDHCTSSAIGAASLFIERILLKSIEKEN